MFSGQCSKSKMAAWPLPVDARRITHILCLTMKQNVFNGTESYHSTNLSTLVELWPGAICTHAGHSKMAARSIPVYLACALLRTPLHGLCSKPYRMFLLPLRYKRPMLATIHLFQDGRQSTSFWFCEIRVKRGNFGPNYICLLCKCNFPNKMFIKY